MSVTYADRPWLDHYDKAVPRDFEPPIHTIPRFLERSAKSHPEKTALIFRGTKVSYRLLNKLANRIADNLVANGFKKGDRAVIYMPNTPQFVITYFGILKAGGCVIATNPLYTPRELEHQLHDCGAETVFVMSLFYNTLKQVQKTGKTNVKRIIVTNVKEYFPLHLKVLFTLAKEKKDGHRVELESGDMWFQDFLAAGEKAPEANVNVTPDDLALFQYTGGTTGLSKGAVGLHRNVVANVYMAKSWLTGIIQDTKETTLLSIPMFHSYGMIGGMLLSIAAAGTLIVIVNPRDQSDVLGSINKYKPTLFPGVPAMYIAINNNPDVLAGKYDLSSIRVCLSGAAPLLKDTKDQFEKITGGKLVEAFGLSEALVATHVNPIAGVQKEGSIGVPLPGIDAKIVDANDPDKELAVGEIGELIIKSPSNMQSYWQLPEATESTIRDGWLYTGDIARMDEDGYFFIEDRKKDMIIAGGYNIYPREVEEVLAMHPAVQEVAVGGVQDPRRGETVKAWVVRQPGDNTSADEIKEWSKTQLAAYKYPRHIEFRDELPKSTVGKVLKRELIRQEKEKAG